MSSFTQFAVFFLLLLLFPPTHFNSHHFKPAHANGLCSSPSPSGGNNGTDLDGMKLHPLIDEKKKMVMMVMMNETRRKLNSFQLCAPCTCCGAKGICLAAPCCYAIKCNIPGKPFGFCAFTPKACHCIGCHL